MLKTKYKNSLVASVVLSALYAAPSLAKDIYFGENDENLLQINSQISIGASWRLEDPDSRLISRTNGGAGFSATTDDGNLNFDQGETFSKIIKGNTTFQLSRDNMGAFVRVKYWYDKELEDESRAHGNNPNNYMAGAPLSDEGFADFTKFSGVEILDAYVYLQTDLGDMPFDLRVGRQVVSWGESTFIQGGISSVNPLDVSAFRRPGAELKEGLLPVGMVYANLGLTETLSIEAFYQYEWEKTQIDGCGTLFSSADYAASGCDRVTIGPGDAMAVAGGYYAKREADLEPDDGGQYGIALRYIAEELNDSEFGLYFLNIHSRAPMVSAIRGQWRGFNPALPVLLPHSSAVDLNAAYPTLAAGAAAGVLTPEQMGQFGLASVLQTTGVERETIDALNPGYLIEFPEDLKFYGLSFATNVGGTALSGEMSYKPDTPIQINGPELLNGALSEAAFLRYTPRVVASEPGEYVRGWDAFDVTQIQVTAVHFFEQVMGASRLTLIGEAGLILTDDIESADQKYGRNAVFGLGDFDVGNGINCTNLVAAGALAGDCRSDGFVTDSAWGYKVRAVWEYSDVFAGVSLKPTIAWSHDVSGYSPEPGQQFHEGRKSLGFAVEASYQQKYTANIGYQSFSGGSHNIAEDKDFLAVSFGFSF